MSRESKQVVCGNMVRYADAEATTRQEFLKHQRTLRPYQGIHCGIQQESRPLCLEKKRSQGGTIVRQCYELLQLDTNNVINKPIPTLTDPGYNIDNITCSRSSDLCRKPTPFFKAEGFMEGSR